MRGVDVHGDPHGGLKPQADLAGGLLAPNEASAARMRFALQYPRRGKPTAWTKRGMRMRRTATRRACPVTRPNTAGDASGSRVSRDTADSTITPAWIAKPTTAAHTHASIP
ncbi:hypothetical protein Bsp3421_004224 [Burkholderia sp. FERM BP-3421]|jgi:hypothetical protein|uniref:hypothetical protein n=1 Tax=Burkholderia sp. FERM BP-3421 TaxID=1494466 RepID=UPI0023624E82|nr:hypothetical protein [Burkholderia sp. FERM BP-3421]WDD94115.1 hypothetical protein Bsp3421_004224 [Burkholderia sp. FERM BP-3421]